MKKLIRAWKIILLDTLGVLCMIGAILTGWLPGPGGIPLFIVGLSLLAVNHEWAKRHIEKIDEYVNKLGDFIFTSNPKVQLLYDLITPVAVGVGAYWLWQHSALWMLSAGLVLIFGGLTLFLGNRKRWHRIKARLKQKL